MSVSVHSQDPSLLDQIFSAVQLPTVKSDEVHDHHIKAEQESILAELDQVLQKQRSLSESSESSTHTLQEPSHHHEHDEHFYDDVASENHYDTIPDDYVHRNQEPPIPSHRHQSYDSLAAEEVDEFPTDHRPVHAEIGSLRRLKPRSRSQTIDSQVSAAESRFGGFDVQDESDRYKGSQIDLFHDEVAYIRPKKTMAKGVSESKSEVSRKQPTPKATPRQSFHSAERPLIHTYVQQVSVTKSRRSSTSSVHSLAKPLPSARNGKAVPILPTNGNHSKQPSTFNGSATFEAPTLESPTEFNDTVVEHLENGTLLHEIGGYGIIQPSYTEFYQEKFRHLVIGNPGQVKEEEKFILLIGESGVGKTSFINSALNYLYGVEREYDFRFAIEPPNEIQPTRDQVNIYTFCRTVLGQKISIVDTPGIEKEDTLDLIKQWIKARLNKRQKLKLDGLVVFEKHGEGKFNRKFEAKYHNLEQLFGGDIRSLIVPAYTFSNNYIAQTSHQRAFANLPFPIDSYLLFNNAGFYPTPHNLQQLIHYKTSVASFDELFFAINYKLHPVVITRRR